jgi:DNA polymerase III epsilon subunit-like protein
MGYDDIRLNHQDENIPVIEIPRPKQHAVMYLFFDTETTGLSRNSDHVVQVAWILADEHGRVESEECHVIRPQGFSIPWQAAEIHGITTAIAEKLGKPLHYVLKQLSADAEMASVIVAHNLSFDLNILQNDYDHIHLPFPFHGKTQVCTMRLSTTWCRLPKLNGGTGFKWPKLEELHYRLFGKAFDNAHDALSDTRACMRCYFDLVERGVIDPPPPRVKLGHKTQRSTTERRNNTYIPTRTNSWQVTVIQLDQLRNVQVDKLVTTIDCDDFSEDLIAAIADITGYEIRNIRISNAITHPNLSNYCEDFGDDLVDLIRRVAGAVVSESNMPPVTDKDVDGFGIDLVEVVARVTLREDAKQKGYYFGKDVENQLGFKARNDDPTVRITVASDHNCPEEIQLLLADDADENVRVALAKNTACTSEVFERLAHDACDGVTEGVEANPSCPESILVAIYHSSDEPGIGLAANPSCPPSLLAHICWTWPGTEYAIAARANPSYSRDEYITILREMSASSDFERGCVAELEDCPPDILEVLSRDECFAVQRYVAKNPSTPENVLVALSQRDIDADEDEDDDIVEDLDDDDPYLGSAHVREAALSNKYPPAEPEVLRLLAPQRGLTAIGHSQNPNTGDGVLQYPGNVKLWESPRQSRGFSPINKSNPLYQAISANTPEERFRELSLHSNTEVRRLAAANKNAPEDVIDKLAVDFDDLVRQDAAENEHASTATLITLANDPSPSVRAAVAAHIKCPKNLFQEFVKDKSAAVRVAAGENPNCSMPALVALAASPFHEYRLLVVQHPRCTVDLFQKLANDPEWVVRKAIVDNDKCPIDIRAPLYMNEKYVMAQTEENDAVDEDGDEGLVEGIVTIESRWGT